MTDALNTFLFRLRQAPAVLVTVASTRGSVPREAGTWMAVFENDSIGTIGGGHLEWDAIRRARESLRRCAVDVTVQSVTLGPTLGQCCGGALQLSYAWVSAADVETLAARLRSEVSMPVIAVGLITEPAQAEAIVSYLKALTLVAGAGYTVGSGAAVSGSVLDDDQIIHLAVTPAAVEEDGSSKLVYTFTRTATGALSRPDRKSVV